MIRKSTLNINYSNKSKLDKLDSILIEYKNYVNSVIDYLWNNKLFNKKFINTNDSKLIKSNTFMSKRLQQCAGKQASQIVKSQRKLPKNKQVKPEFKKDIIEFDQRFIDIQINKSSKEFDIWIKFQSLGNKIILNIPSKKHYHFNKFKDWNIKKSCRLRKTVNGYFIDIFFERDKPELKTTGNSIGIDIGFKKLAIDSNRNIYDTGLSKIYDKISRKQQGSKSFKRSLIERSEETNKSAKQIFKQNINLKTIIIEDLKNVKHKSKFNNKVNNKLQRWRYSHFIHKVENICEEIGVQLIRVNPSYTSQTCSCCNNINKKSRNGESYKCNNCGLIIDADYNAAINILHRGLSENMVPILTENKI